MECNQKKVIGIQKWKTEIRYNQEGKYHYIVRSNDNLWNKCIKGYFIKEMKVGKTIWIKPDNNYSQMVKLVAILYIKTIKKHF